MRWRLIVLVTCTARIAFAGSPEEPETPPEPKEHLQFIDHPAQGPLYFGAQHNNILQMKPGFRADYSGENSLSPRAESAISGLATAFFAYNPWKVSELIVHAEMAYGGGLSETVGLAGFTNLDVVRNPSLSSEPYLARVQWHQLIPLTDTWIDNPDRGPISSFEKLPLHRMELRVGRFSTADLFDNNLAASDSHRQFMNWAVDNNAAYDYAADTRGYTYGAAIEYEGPRIEFRFAEMLMPKVANGLVLDWDLARARSENMELEVKYSTADNWMGTFRALGYVNHAQMGSYQESIDRFRAGVGPVPDVTATRRPGRTKAGVALGWVQQFFGLIRGFARWGMNDGHNESFAYTEAEDTFEIGMDIRGGPWGRRYDRAGLAIVTNGLSAAHREYLRLGGRGFLLGDGNLDYQRENILEHYYTLHVWRGFSIAGDIQLIQNPGYNARRGPVTVLSFRTHFDF